MEEALLGLLFAGMGRMDLWEQGKNTERNPKDIINVVFFFCKVLYNRLAESLGGAGKDPA